MSSRVGHLLATVLILSHTVAPVLAADSSQVNFKIFSPPGSAQADTSANPPAEAPAADAAAKPAEAAASSPGSMWTEGEPGSQVPPGETPLSPGETTSSSPTPAAGEIGGTSSGIMDTSGSSTTASPTASDTATPASSDAAAGTAGAEAADAAGSADGKDSKVLQGYVRVVPSGTKLPIIMDSAIDSDTSQEGDEFAARTSEDLTIDGATVVPAGSVIKGRIARINAPKRLGRSGSVGLKFDTITTPDNKQIALQATLVARGGVVHARRGLKDIAMDTGMVAAPMAVGAVIGAIAGSVSSNSNSNSSSSSSNSKLGVGGGLLIGVGVGTAIGVIILCAKKGKRVDMRPGDELKIELAEDLRMPM